MFETRSINLENLRIISELMPEIPFFLFFGSLLGVVREKNLLLYDDDVDLLVDIKFYDEVVAILKSDKCPFDVDFSKEINKTGYFLNCKNNISGYKSQLDFYFYVDDQECDYIVEKWNFRGFSEVHNENFDIHIPKNLVFPLSDFVFSNGLNVKIPKQSKNVVAWLYGDDWKTPLSKGNQYIMEVKENKPCLVRIGILRYIYMALKKRAHLFVSNFKI
ncbi:LicD family protein [Roseobacter sp. HKCCD5988]|uniref:LicD family protein n=1 Tax=Roseobacter sp. HKCCD5988 TaxID=3120338 RepID=UPI0030ED9515